MKWVCDRCGSESDSEHAPCDCDGEVDDLIDEIGRVRAANTKLLAERVNLRRQLAIATAALERIVGAGWGGDGPHYFARAALAEMRKGRP